MKDPGVLELSTLSIPNLYAARALAWSWDGTKLNIATQTGAVLQLEAVLRRWVWRDAVEVQHVSAKQLVIARLAQDAPPLTVTAKLAPDIYNVRFIGNDWYAVCRTTNSLILCDLARGLTSEIPWSGTGERIYAAVGGACLIHRAGELSVVEYGLDRVLLTVRTERVNPHVLSVRINEARAAADARDNKRLAYLLDRQTVAVLDLVTGIQVGQWWHETRVDWLELNESGSLLLLRDTRRRLVLLRLQSGDKEIIASGVSFVQWVENSDAIVAQTPTHLLVWYSALDVSALEMLDCGGGIAVEARDNSVLFEGGSVPCLQLDSHRLAFNNALSNDDLVGCARYLNEVDGGADVAQLWRQLADRALAAEDILLAAKCYKEIGDDARTFYLEKTVELAINEGNGEVVTGMQSPLVRARLAILAGDLASAEEFYVKKAGQYDLAIQMYKQYNRWIEAIALAERSDPGSVQVLRQQYMDYLIATGKSERALATSSVQYSNARGREKERYTKVESRREKGSRLGEAGAALAAAGDERGAVRMWLRGGRARRAATLLLQNPILLRDTELTDAVHAQLLQEEWWEMAGEISEKKGDTSAAVEYYAKGHNFARAVQLAREACPGEVTRLEGEWGAWLVGARQAGAAVPHLIEAGDTRAALSAALRAHHYRKALHILQVIEDKESIREQCEQLGDHFISTQDWDTAERVLSECGLSERCVRAYNAAGKYEAGLKLAAKDLTEERAQEIYMPLAQKLRQEEQYRKAEQIYIGLGEHDEAISMYKEIGQYESMLRLVATYRNSLLEATRRHVAQALHASGDLRAAETYYLQAGEWKSAIQMYRSAGQWEGAERVARAHAPPAAQQQVALLWAAALGGVAGAKLLAARGLAAAGARWALQAQREAANIKSFDVCRLTLMITVTRLARSLDSVSMMGRMRLTGRLLPTYAVEHLLLESVAALHHSWTSATSGLRGLFLITCRQNFLRGLFLITCRQNFFVCEAPSGARPPAVADVADG
ncbi:Intraflagellar transport protein 172 homolog [Eumeta japonica]|uniref:Intraflagellar transport protein 172 homolog n=1 Tax=Eumeta variegata TaxID=151549 RepID=A0A4C1TMI8_EUMVA|nr:Intraflagellar transport protein 172 homolog [Eumeta japonica]